MITCLQDKLFDHQCEKYRVLFRFQDRGVQVILGGALGGDTGRELYREDNLFRSQSDRPKHSYQQYSEVFKTDLCIFLNILNLVLL